MEKKHNYYMSVYKNLEDELIELSKHIHIDDKQMNVYSIYIADLIIRCAVEIEAISKDLYIENGGPFECDDNISQRNLFFDTDCINYLDNIWGICKKEIFVSCDSFFLNKEENIVIRPLYNAYKRGGAMWNKAYQAVKHDRRASIEKGNIRNLIHALGSLYILNLYYQNENVELGTTNNPMKYFDSRMGSSIFSVSTEDMTSDIEISANPHENGISQEKIEKCKHAIYIVRYKKESWDRMKSAILEDNNRLIEVLKEHDAFHNNQWQHNKHPEDARSDFLGYVIKVLGMDYIKKNNPYINFNMALNSSQKEAILNRNEPIY